MELVLSRWAEAFSRWHPASGLEIDGKGSVAAVQILSRFGADFVALSRAPSDSELRSGALVAVYVGWDSLRVVRRGGTAFPLPDPVRIFSGESGPWRPFGRNLASGTRAEAGFALGAGRFGPGVRTMPSPGRVAEAVAADPWAVAYAGGGWNLSRVRPCGPPLRARPLVLAFPVGPLRPRMREFLSFVLSRQGQDLVAASGFQPLSADSVRVQRRRLGLDG
jgi:phosphate transport system substrate-binding protein